MRAGEWKEGTVAIHIAWWLGLLLAVPVIVQAERLPIKTYTTADGLGSMFIECIVRDSRGFLWICTRDGLSRFDGYRFITYTMEHGLPDPTINHLLETRKGVYWVATNGGGVCRFNPTARGPSSVAEKQQITDNRQRTTDQRLFTIYPVGDEPQTNRVNVLYEDRAGRLWAGTDGGLFRLDEKSGQFRRVELGLPSRPDRSVGVGAFAEDREGSLWIGTGWGLVRRWPDGRMNHYAVQPSPVGNAVRALLLDREGRLWVGTGNAGLIVLNPDQLRISDSGLRNQEPSGDSKESNIRNGQIRIPHSAIAAWYTTADGLANNVVAALHQSSDGRIWIGTSGGLTEFNGERFRTYTTAQGLSDTIIGHLAEDRDGNLWIGSSNGAMKLTLSGFTTYDEADGLGHTQIHSIYEDQAGDVLVVSGDWYINRFDGQRFVSVQPDLPRDAAYRWASQVGFLDRTGQWWLLTTKGLCRFARVSRIEQLARKRPEAVYTSRARLPSDSVTRLFEDARGDIWIGTWSGKQNELTRWERATETFHPYSTADGLPPSNAPSAFCQDRSGTVWIGFSHGGLARYHHGRFTLFTVADGVPAGMITALYLDHAGRLWVGSNQSGLSRVDDPTADRLQFVAYTTAQGLASNNVRCITEDRWGRIYIGTVRGVNQLDPATGHIKHYTTADGLANEFVTAAFRDRQGALWFGTMKGLSRLISALDRPQSPPPIWIGGLRIAGVPYLVSELGQTEVSGLELGPNQNHLQINFFSLSFAAGEVLRFQYKLEGADADWSPPTDQRTVNYASLAPGTYRFLVRAVSAEGTASPTPATIAFTILPPIWQQWWFLALLAMIAGVVIYAIHHYRVARLLELERVRARSATDLHDDIGASLSEMAILSEVVKRQISATHHEAVETLGEMAQKARELMDSMSDIVWAIDPRRDDLSNLVARIRQFASSVLEANRIGWEFQTPAEVENIKLTPDERRHVFLIFKEAITNIARHADCSFVSLRISIADRHLVAEIRDDGRGFTVPDVSTLGEPDRQRHGLKNMQARAVELGGQLQMESAPGQGTRLTLMVPLK